MDIKIIGAGPAGLTAAWELNKHGKKALILEADNTVGGISRTVEMNGWRFDIGGHRFFTKVDEVYDIWDEILAEEDFLLRPRMSRIYYNRKFFDYPLKASNALFNFSNTAGGKDAEDDLKNLKFKFFANSKFLSTGMDSTVQK